MEQWSKGKNDWKRLKVMWDDVGESFAQHEVLFICRAWTGNKWRKWTRCVQMIMSERGPGAGKGGSWKRKDAFSLNWFAGETTNSSELLLASVIVVFSKIHRLFPLLGPCIDLPSARDKSRAANSIFTICFPNLSSRLLMFSRWQAHLREAKLLMTMSTEKTAIDFTTHSA
jgi:hypothetical protein